MSPEMLNKQYTEKTDVWSLGVIFYTLIMRKIPFDGVTDDEVFHSVKNKQLYYDSALKQKKSIEMIDLIKRMLYKNDESRINSHDAINHKWLRILGKDRSLK